MKADDYCCRLNRSGVENGHVLREREGERVGCREEVDGRGRTGRRGCISNIDVNVAALHVLFTLVGGSHWPVGTGFTVVGAADLLDAVDVTAGQCTKIPWNLPDNRRSKCPVRPCPTGLSRGASTLAKLICWTLHAHLEDSHLHND